MDNKLTTIEMEVALAKFFNYRTSIIVPNVTWGFNIHECDLLVLTKAGCLYEVEIKISKADLKKDLTKKHNHVDRFKRIQGLWFAIPVYLKDCIEFIPENAGIITVEKRKSDWDSKYYFHSKAIRNPKMENVEKLYDNEKFNLARLGTMRIWKLKQKIINMKNK